MECLKLKPGMARAAAFLETRRLAALRGATAEFEALNGLAWSQRFSQVYVSAGRAAKGMASDAQFDHGGRDALRLPKGRCGALFALDVDRTAAAYSAKVRVAPWRRQHAPFAFSTFTFHLLSSAA